MQRRRPLRLNDNEILMIRHWLLFAVDKIDSLRTLANGRDLPAFFSPDEDNYRELESLYEKFDKYVKTNQVVEKQALLFDLKWDCIKVLQEFIPRSLSKEEHCSDAEKPRRYKNKTSNTNG